MSFFLDLLRCLGCCGYDRDDYDFERIERNHFRESPSSIPCFGHQTTESVRNLYTRISVSKDKEVSEDSKFPPPLSASASASVSASSYNSHSSTPKPPESFPKQAQSSYNCEPSKSLKPAVSSSEQPQLSSCQTSSSERSSTKPPPSSPFSLNGPPCPSPQKLSSSTPILPEVACSQTSPKTSKTTQSSASQTCLSPQSSSPKPSPSSFKLPQTSTQPSQSSSSQLNAPPSRSSEELPTLRPILFEVPSNHTSPKPSKTTHSSVSQTSPSPECSSDKPSPSSICVPKPSAQSFPSSPSFFSEPTSSFKLPQTSTQPSPSSSSSLNAPPSRSSEELPTFRPILFEVPSNQTSPKPSKTTQSSVSQKWPSPQCSSAKPSPSSIWVPKPSTQSFRSSPSLFSEPPSSFKLPQTSTQPSPSSSSSLSASPSRSSEELPTFRPVLFEVPRNQTSPKPSKTTQSSASQTWPSAQSSSAKPSPSSIWVPKPSTLSFPSSRSLFSEPPSSFKLPRTSTQPSPSSSSSLNASPSRSSEELPTFRPVLFEVPSNQTSPKPSKTTQSSVSRTWPSPQCSSAKPSPSSIWVPKPSAQSFRSSPSLFSEPPSPSSSSSSSSQKFPIFKPILREAIPNATDQKGKEGYICVERGSLPLYMIPKDIKDLIKKEIVPEILKKPLSPLTYKDYFAALLFAEEYYCEKWSNFEMENVKLELQKSTVSKEHEKHKNVNDGNNEPDDKIFVKFQIDSIPERRPFLLSRDLVYARLSGSEAETYQGVIFRVEGRKNIVLVEFEEDFYIEHDSTQRYDISFSFNRICLKRAHQALNAVSDNLIQNFLFPDSSSRKVIPTSPLLGSQFCKIDSDISSTVSQILSIQGSPPYLVAGPLCVPENKNYSYSIEPSKTGKVVREAVVQIYKSSPECRILISAPSNSACDVLMRSLKEVIPEWDMFRANAAFREKEEVPEDILSSCLYKKECFACPSLDGLKKYRVIFSTFMSSFRLHNEGIHAGHFSHVFLVDASSAIEPEALVTVANFSDKNTTLVVTGRHGNSSRWIRSEIARKRGLRTSYFERLCQCRPYRTLNPKFFSDLGLPDDSYSFR